MYFLLTIVPLFFSFNPQMHMLPLERHVSEIVPGQNSVLIVFSHSFGLYSAFTDMLEYYPLNQTVEECVNIEGTDTYILFGASSIVIFNRFLYQFNAVNTQGHRFVNYRYDRNIFLQDPGGKTYILNISGLFQKDTSFSDWKPIRTNDNVKQFPQLSPYFISKGNNIYHYTSAVRFRDKIFAGTDNFGFFIIDMYSGEKKHILNGILGNMKGVLTKNDKTVIFSDKDIAILQNHHFTFFLDTLFFYPHFYDNITDVEIKDDTIFFSGQYSIYYIYNEGICKFVNSSFKIHDFTFMGNNILYATDNGVNITDGKKHRTILSGVVVYDILKSNKLLLFATDNGIYFMNDDKIGKIEQFPDISYEEITTNDISLAAISSTRDIYFLNLKTDSMTIKPANVHLTKGNICSLDSNFLYISGKLISEYPGNRIFSLPQNPNGLPLGINIMQNNAYFFFRNAVLFTPVNNIFPFLSNR